MREIGDKMKNKRLVLACMICVAVLLSGCSDKKSNEASDANNIEDDKNTVTKVSQLGLKDGNYEIEVILSGGSGRAAVESPTVLEISDGKAVAKIIWSSPYYDYMILNDEKYTPVNTEGNSVFEIPVELLDCDIPVTADTIAMSEPHEIEYTILFSSDTIKKVE